MGGEQGFVSLVQFPVKVLGPGNRLGIWFQGCGRRCRGCISPNTWDTGPETACSLENVVAKLASHSFLTDRLTISGGEPFDQPGFLMEVLRAARAAGFSDVLVYSGYLLEELQRGYPEILATIDVLIDGPFEISLPTRLLYRGSANQRMIILAAGGDIRERYEPLVGQEEDEAQVQVIRRNEQVILVGIPRDSWSELRHG